MQIQWASLPGGIYTEGRLRGHKEEEGEVWRVTMISSTPATFLLARSEVDTGQSVIRAQLHHQAAVLILSTSGLAHSNEAAYGFWCRFNLLNSVHFKLSGEGWCISWINCLFDVWLSRYLEKYVWMELKAKCLLSLEGLYKEAGHELNWITSFSPWKLPGESRIIQARPRYTMKVTFFL